jgi:hypothetical protein
MRVNESDKATKPSEGRRTWSATVNFFLKADPASYCWCLLALVGIALITPLILVKTGLYNRMARIMMLEPNMDYPFELVSQSFDVVIFGDSTGRFDIDPRIVSRTLGLSSANLSENLPFLQLVGEFSLDGYLSRNRKPKLLVLAISPPNVSLSSDVGRSVIGFEAWYALVRHGTPMLALKVLSQNPTSLFNFWSIAMYQTLSLKSSRTKYSVLHEQMLNGKGYTPYPVPVGLTNCPAAPIGQKELAQRHTYINHFTRKYEMQGLKVAVFLTPVPDCHPNLDIFKSSLRGVASNEPYAMPRDVFANDVQASHALPQAVPQISKDLVAAIKPMLVNPASQASIQKIDAHYGAY